MKRFLLNGFCTFCQSLHFLEQKVLNYRYVMWPCKLYQTFLHRLFTLKPSLVANWSLVLVNGWNFFVAKKQTFVELIFVSKSMVSKVFNFLQYSHVLAFCRFQDLVFTFLWSKHFNLIFELFKLYYLTYLKNWTHFVGF